MAAVAAHGPRPLPHRPRPPARRRALIGCRARRARCDWPARTPGAGRGGSGHGGRAGPGRAGRGGGAAEHSGQRRPRHRRQTRYSRGHPERSPDSRWPPAPGTSAPPRAPSSLRRGNRRQPRPNRQGPQAPSALLTVPGSLPAATVPARPTAFPAAHALPGAAGAASAAPRVARPPPRPAPPGLPAPPPSALSPRPTRRDCLL